MTRRKGQPTAMKASRAARLQTARSPWPIMPACKKAFASTACRVVCRLSYLLTGRSASGSGEFVQTGVFGPGTNFWELQLLMCLQTIGSGLIYTRGVSAICWGGWDAGSRLMVVASSMGFRIRFCGLGIKFLSFSLSYPDVLDYIVRCLLLV